MTQPTHQVWYRASTADRWTRTNLGSFPSDLQAREAASHWLAGRNQHRATMTPETVQFRFATNNADPNAEAAERAREFLRLAAGTPYRTSTDNEDETRIALNGLIDRARDILAAHP